MTNFLMALLIGLFVAMLFLNVYFRIKVLKVYKRLVQNKVEFNATDILNKKKLEEEIGGKYPAHKEDIMNFAKYIRFSVNMATVLIVLITLFGGLLMYTR